MWLWLPVRPREVEFREQGFHAEADLNIADSPVRVFGQEVPGYDYVGEGEGKNVVQPLYGFEIPNVVSAVHRLGMTGRSGDWMDMLVLPNSGYLTFACKQKGASLAQVVSHTRA